MEVLAWKRAMRNSPTLLLRGIYSNYKRILIMALGAPRAGLPVRWGWFKRVRFAKAMQAKIERRESNTGNLISTHPSCDIVLLPNQ